MLCKDEYDVDNVESSSFKDVISAGSFSGSLRFFFTETPESFGSGEVGEGGETSSATRSLSGSISTGREIRSVRLRASVRD